MVKWLEKQRLQDCDQLGMLKNNTSKMLRSCPRIKNTAFRYHFNSDAATDRNYI